MAIDVIRERLANQILTGPRLNGPAEVVRRQGAVQAQDYTGAKWAIGMRTKSSTHSDIEQAVARGDILRTHVLRPTWHFVLPEDIRWMLALTGPRISQVISRYNPVLGLTPAVLRRTRRVIEKALRDGAHLTRQELGEILQRERVCKVTGERLGRVMMMAEVDGVVCSGACRGKQFTYGLLDLRAPSAAPIDRDDALSRLAGRYFTSHGPASVHDFSWWSGLSVGDARRAVEMLGQSLTAVTVGEARLFMIERETSAPSTAGTAHLLPNYDEYFIGHRDRSAIGRRLKGVGLVTGGDSSITHVAIVNGELVGGWRRTTTPAGMTATLTLMARVSRAERDLLERERARFAAFF
jgi:hypothetical protein